MRESDKHKNVGFTRRELLFGVLGVGGVAAAILASQRKDGGTPSVAGTAKETDPTKKQVEDWLQAFLDGRLEATMALTPVVYRDAYRDYTRAAMRTYSPCRGRKIIDVSILETRDGPEGVGQLDQPCTIDVGGFTTTVRQIGVWLVKVDGKLQPIKPVL